MNSSDRLALYTFLGVILIITIAISAVGVVAIIADSTTRDELPRCLEQQVLEGFGEFDNGRWDDYICVSWPD